MVGDRHLPARY